MPTANVLEIGSKWGTWTVISDAPRRHGTYCYLCRCECGGEWEIAARTLRSGASKGCRDCKRKYPSFEGISGCYYNQCKNGAEKRGIPWLLSIEDMWLVWQKQGGLCALTGEPLTQARGTNTTDYTASLDRIDSSKPYESGNVQWLEKEINRLKNNYSEEDLIKMCQKVADYRR